MNQTAYREGVLTTEHPIVGATQFFNTQLVWDLLERSTRPEGYVVSAFAVSGLACRLQEGPLDVVDAKAWIDVEYLGRAVALYPSFIAREPVVIMCPIRIDRLMGEDLLRVSVRLDAEEKRELTGTVALLVTEFWNYIPWRPRAAEA